MGRNLATEWQVEPARFHVHTNGPGPELNGTGLATLTMPLMYKISADHSFMPMDQKSLFRQLFRMDRTRGAAWSLRWWLLVGAVPKSEKISGGTWLSRTSSMH